MVSLSFMAHYFYELVESFVEDVVYMSSYSLRKIKKH